MSAMPDAAVAKVGPLELGGFVAWVAWLLLHLVYLVGFKSKMTTADFVDSDLPNDEPKPTHHRPAAGFTVNRPSASNSTRFTGQGHVTT